MAEKQTRLPVAATIPKQPVQATPTIPVSNKQEGEEIDQVNFGGRIRLFTQNRKAITSDTTILDMIEGVKLQFHKCPQQKCTPKSYKFEKEDKQLITEELSTFFNRSIIERAISDPDQIVSNIIFQ